MIEGSINDQPEIWKQRLLKKILECAKSGETEIAICEGDLNGAWFVENVDQRIDGETFNRRKIEIWLAFNKLYWTLDQNSTDDEKYILRKTG